MLPMISAGGGLGSITQNGAPVSFVVQTVKGIQYAVFSAVTGTYQASYTSVAVSVSPAAAALSASQGQQFTATVTGSPNQSVSWTSSNPSVGSLTSTGLYTAP